MIANTNRQAAYPIQIQTSILYGVFVTEKSWLIGWQRLIKREHAKILCKKAAGNRLPQELLDIVGDRLYESLMQPVERVLNEPVDLEPRYRKFPNSPGQLTPAERAVEQKLVS